MLTAGVGGTEQVWLAVVALKSPAWSFGKSALFFVHPQLRDRRGRMVR